MVAPENRKIVIQVHWDRIFNFRVALLFVVAILAVGFGYWYRMVRPYFWIADAHVESFSAPICADVSGRITEMGPQEGEIVQKGQPLLSLDKDLLTAKLQQARCALASFAEQVELEKERFGRALENYLTATTELETGVGSEERVKKQLALMEESQERSDLAVSNLSNAQASTAELELQMRKAQLVAPFDGVVLKRAKNLGSVVAFGETVYLLSDPKRTWIEAAISEKDLAHVQVGAAARVHLSAYPNQEFVGKVVWIAPATVAKIQQLAFSAENVVIPIRIAVENADAFLKPGLTAQVGLIRK